MPVSVDLGTAAHLAVNVTDATGALANVATMTLAVTQPDGTPAVGSPFTVPTPSTTGKYAQDFTPTQAGRHLVAWSGSGGAAGTFVVTDVLNVWPADPRYLLSLDEARAAIRKEWSSTATDDDDIRFDLAAVTPVIEDICGPVISTAKTYKFDGGRVAVLLPGPVSASSVTVKENGSTLATGDFTVDERAGIVWGGDKNAPRRFVYGHQNIEVTFTVGSSVIPPNVRKAAAEEFRFLWQIGRQGNRPGFGNEPVAEVFTPSGFAVPRRVIELCRASERLEGFA